jgi:hypothetical protein
MIFVLIFFSVVFSFPILFVVDKLRRSPEVKERYRGEIENQRKALADEPEKFDNWLSSRKREASDGRFESDIMITLIIAVPLAFFPTSLISGWLNS